MTRPHQEHLARERLESRPWGGKQVAMVTDTEEVSVPEGDWVAMLEALVTQVHRKHAHERQLLIQVYTFEMHDDLLFFYTLS